MAASPPARKKDKTTLVILVAVAGMLLFNFLPILFVVGIYVLIALIGGGALGFGYFFTPGDIHVHCLEGEPTRIVIDGDRTDTCNSGSTASYEVDRGPHTVHIQGLITNDAVEHRIEVKSGFHGLVLPAHENQCFVRLDVTDYEYRAVYRRGEGLKPEIVETYSPEVPFDLPSNTYLSEESLPEYLDDAAYAYLLLDLPCDMLEKDPGEILQHLGY